MGRVLTPRALGNADHASEQGAVIASLRSTVGEHFIASIAKNGMATASIPGLSSNEIRIRSIGVLCTQPLLLRVMLFGDSNFTESDISLDKFITATRHNLPDLAQSLLLHDERDLIYRQIYSGGEAGPSYDMVATANSLLRVYSAGAGNDGLRYQVKHPPFWQADFSTGWSAFQNDVDHTSLMARCDWGYDATGNRRLLAYHYEQEAAGRKVHELVLDEEGGVISSAQVGSGWGAGVEIFMALACRHDPPGNINSPTVMVTCNSNTAVTNEMRAYVKPWGGSFANAGGPAAFNSAPYVVLDVDVLHYSGDQWAIFFVGVSGNEYAIFRLTASAIPSYAAMLLDKTAVKIYSSRFQIGRPFICKVGDSWRLQFNRGDLWDYASTGSRYLATLVSTDLLGGASSWKELPDLSDASLRTPRGVALAYTPHTALLSLPAVVFQAETYQQCLNNLSIPYRDTELKKRLHVGIANLSPTSKRAYPQDELLLDIGYERVA